MLTYGSYYMKNAAESLLIDMKVKYAESENETDTLRRHLNEMRKIMAV